MRTRSLVRAGPLSYSPPGTAACLEPSPSSVPPSSPPSRLAVPCEPPHLSRDLLLQTCLPRVQRNLRRCDDRHWARGRRELLERRLLKRLPDAVVPSRRSIPVPERARQDKCGHGALQPERARVPGHRCARRGYRDRVPGAVRHRRRHERVDAHRGEHHRAAERLAGGAGPAAARVLEPVLVQLAGGGGVHGRDDREQPRVQHEWLPGASGVGSGESRHLVR